MPVTTTYPGVYIEELPSGVRTITGVATSITAFVGYTKKGPIDKATRVYTFGEYVRTFGDLDRESDVSYAIQQFFQNGGSDAYVVRVASGAAVASIELEDAAGGTALTVRAKSAGTWGNLVRLEVDRATRNPDSTFNLRVIRYESKNSETTEAENEHYRDLSMNSRSAFFAPNVINAASKIIELDTTVGTAASQRGWSLSGSYATTFPTLAAGENTITGVLDGSLAFTLVLPNPATIVDWATLLPALTAAINNAGLTGRLTAARARATGALDAAGNYLRLTSQSVAPSNVAAEFSSVEIVPAPTNDASEALSLGLANGGREKDGSSWNRPLPTGTLSNDLSDLTATITGSIDVTVEDRGTSPAAELFSGTFSWGGAGTALEDAPAALEAWLNAQAPAQGTAVRRTGPIIQVDPPGAGAKPNVVITFADPAGAAAADRGATNARLTGPVNPSQYSVGTAGIVAGTPVGAQANGVGGQDGAPPTAAELIGDENNKTGMYALKDADLFNILVIPGTTRLSDTEAISVYGSALTLCEAERAFLIVDPHPSATDVADWAEDLNSKNGAIYFPRIRAADPLDNFRLRDMPASGAIAGIYARTDAQRGVWKAPAGTESGIRGARAVSVALTDAENGPLNQAGVNVLRDFPVYGRVVWGARTLLGSDEEASEWKYVPVRRLTLMIEESLFRGTKWVVFEPNDEPLWAQIRLNVGAFMHNLFRRGAFQGKSSREAYFVKCDNQTTTQNDVDLGRVNIVVGFAPLKPAEFVVIQIQQIAGQVQT